MENTIRLSEVFASTRSGRIIASIEWGICLGLMFFILSLIIFPIMTMADAQPHHHLMTDFEMAILMVIIGMLIGLRFGSVAKISLVLWRVFKPNDAKITAYKEKEVRRLGKVLEDNNAKIQNLERDNAEVQKAIEALS